MKIKADRETILNNGTSESIKSIRIYINGYMLAIRHYSKGFKSSYSIGTFKPAKFYCICIGRIRISIVEL